MVHLIWTLESAVVSVPVVHEVVVPPLPVATLFHIPPEKYFHWNVVTPVVDTENVAVFPVFTACVVGCAMMYGPAYDPTKFEVSDPEIESADPDTTKEINTAFALWLVGSALNVQLAV